MLLFRYLQVVTFVLFVSKMVIREHFCEAKRHVVRLNFTNLYKGIPHVMYRQFHNYINATFYNKVALGFANYSVRNKAIDDYYNDLSKYDFKEGLFPYVVRLNSYYLDFSNTRFYGTKLETNSELKIVGYNYELVLPVAELCFDAYYDGDYCMTSERCVNYRKLSAGSGINVCYGYYINPSVQKIYNIPLADYNHQQLILLRDYSVPVYPIMQAAYMFAVSPDLIVKFNESLVQFKFPDRTALEFLAYSDTFVPFRIDVMFYKYLCSRAMGGLVYIGDIRVFSHTSCINYVPFNYSHFICYDVYLGRDVCPDILFKRMPLRNVTFMVPVRVNLSTKVNNGYLPPYSNLTNFELLEYVFAKGYNHVSDLIDYAIGKTELEKIITKVKELLHDTYDYCFYRYLQLFDTKKTYDGLGNIVRGLSTHLGAEFNNLYNWMLSLGFKKVNLAIEYANEHIIETWQPWLLNSFKFILNATKFYDYEEFFDHAKYNYAWFLDHLKINFTTPRLTKRDFDTDDDPFHDYSGNWISDLLAALLKPFFRLLLIILKEFWRFLEPLIKLLFKELFFVAVELLCLIDEHLKTMIDILSPKLDKLVDVLLDLISMVSRVILRILVSIEEKWFLSEYVFVMIIIFYYVRNVKISIIITFIILLIFGFRRWFQSLLLVLIHEQFYFRNESFDVVFEVDIKERQPIDRDHFKFIDDILNP